LDTPTSFAIYFKDLTSVRSLINLVSISESFFYYKYKPNLKNKRFTKVSIPKKSTKINPEITFKISRILTLPLNSNLRTPMDAK